MIILRQNHYSKADLNKLGQETDKDIREAVKGTKVEKKVEKILEKSTKEMKEAAQKEYAAISDEGRVAMKSRDALEEARNLGYTKKAAVKAAKRILDKAKEEINKQEKIVRDTNNSNRRKLRTRIGFMKDTIGGKDWKEDKFGRVMIGFHPDQTESTGQAVKLGFKKFSKINNPGVMTVEDVFSISLIRGLGKNIAVATGKVESGSFRVGDKVEISDGKNKIQTEIKGIQIFRKTVDKVSKGDDAGLEFSDISFRDIKRGMIIKVISPDQKQFSKQDREVVPDDIVKKVKEGDGVIQKDHNGNWRIISMKTKTNKSGKPEFWDAKYDSKEAASKALGGYFANKH